MTALDMRDGDIERLAEEFRAKARGPYSPALQRVLNQMRGLPVAGKHILIHGQRTRRYTLAQLTGQRGRPIVRHDEISFETVAEAEWHVFQLRWRQLTGQTLADLPAKPCGP
jgi:branched-chain amino acid transport system permease protein